MSAQIKVVGVNGQISLGKEFAGKTVLVDQIGEGSWVIHSGKFIPDSEKWLYANPDELAQLDRAIARAEKTKPIDNFDVLIKEFEHAAKNKN